MIISGHNVTIQLNAAETARLAAIVNDDTPSSLAAAASQALSHVVGILSGESQHDPIMLDVHVFIANKMLEDEGAPIDRASIELLLDAWRTAELSLWPDARKALRLVAPLCTMVVRAKDKRAFEAQFDAEMLPQLNAHNSANYLRTYLEAIQAWQELAAPLPTSNAHYLENMVYHVFKTIIVPVQQEKGLAFVKKRLTAAKDALDSYLFE